MLCRSEGMAPSAGGLMDQPSRHIAVARIYRRVTAEIREEMEREIKNKEH